LGPPPVAGIFTAGLAWLEHCCSVLQEFNHSQVHGLAPAQFRSVLD